MNQIPSATHSGLTFFPIPQFGDVRAAFGASEKDFFPDRRNLPKVPSKHCDAAMQLFYSGGKLPEFDPRVDKAAAARATRAWLASFAPSHEAKEATVGYAFWVWSTPEAIDAAMNGANA